jgi:indolepyruvate decarboxylase
MTTIGQFLLRRLKELGIQHIFGVAGDFNLEFLEQIEAEDGIRFVGNCNELNGSYAADGYARSAGAGALLTTYGVGELSAINGIAGAYSERVPVVAITGAPPLSGMQKRALLHHTSADGNYEDMMACMRQFTVAQSRLTPQNAAVEIDRCLRACFLEKRPVYLQLPSDIALLSIDVPEGELNVEYGSDPAMLLEFVRRVMARLHAATRPALLVDADVDRFCLDGALKELLEASELPTALLSSAKGILADSDPHCVGLYSGSVSRPEVRRTIEDSDCLITFGVRLTDATTGAFSHSINPASEIKINDWGGSEGGEDFLGLSMRDVLRQLTVELRKCPLTPAARPEKTVTVPVSDSGKSAPQPLVHAAFWKCIATFVREGDVVIAENGTPFSGLMGVPLPSDIKVISQPIWGSIGYTLPATLGSAFAEPERRHILLIGDGSFQVSVQELSTILRHRLRPIIFLLNNDGYTIERLILGENAAYNDIQPWRYSDLCRVFDKEERFTTMRVETCAELDEALQIAAEPEHCTFIEVILPRIDAPPLLKALGPVFAKQDYGMKWEMEGRPGGRISTE